MSVFEAIAAYYDRAVKVGHTFLSLHGLKKYGKICKKGAVTPPTFVVYDRRTADAFGRSSHCKNINVVALDDLQSVLPSRDSAPIAFDNAAIHELCAKGADLEAQNRALKAKVSELSATNEKPSRVLMSTRLGWSEAFDPDTDVCYNHVASLTPFGRFLITWKGWKDCPDYTIYEVPWGGNEFPAFGSLLLAEEWCEKEYKKRLGLSLGEAADVSDGLGDVGPD